MNSDDRDLVFSIVTIPGHKAKVTKQDILHHFNTTDGGGLGSRLLRETAGEKDPVGLEAAIIVCNVFGFDAGCLELLIDLVPAEWHHQHENIVSMLGKLKDGRAVEVLLYAATWVPDYLDWDENRALAVKAVWGLGGTPGAEAERALLALSRNDNEIVRENAKAQLKRRNREYE